MIALGRVSAWLLFATIALAPLPFGSATSTAIAFWCVILGLVLVAAPTKALRKPHFILLGCAAVTVAAYAVVLHEQLAPHPWFSIAKPNPLWSQAAKALGTPLHPSVSIARHEPYFALGSPLVCMLSLICGFLTGTDRHHARAIVWFFAGSGVAYGLYGIAAYLLDPMHVLWLDKTAYGDSLTGTFINRNTAAVYFGSCAIVCLMLLCDLIRQDLPRGPIEWRKIPDWLFSRPPRYALVLSGMLFVCVTAMMMTKSRAGVLISLLAIIVAFVLYFHRDLPRRSGVVAAALGVGAGALLVLQFMGGGVNARFDAEGLASEGRSATWRATIRMIAEHPWFGTGQGTFVWSFPAYRSDTVSMVGIWDRAHNTLLELAADMGIPLATLVALGWILMLVILIHGAAVRRRDLLLPVTAFAVAMLALLHSMVDFSLQIAGYAIPALTLVGAGLAQSFASDRGIAKHSRSNSPEDAFIEAE
jgi:O-antigen ligase